MIMITNERNGHKTKFKNYQRLHSHLESYQRTKIYNRPNQLIDEWVFACHSRRRFMAFYEFASMQRKPLRFDVLEMSYENSNQPVILPITPALDIETLREDWCRRYCESHGYELIDVHNDDGILHVKKTENPPVNGE